MSKQKPLNRITAFFIMCLFVLTQVVNPLVNQVQAEPLPKIEASQVKIPDNLGRVKEVFQGAGGDLVIHIQTAHMNVEVEQNIAKIIEHLNRQWGLSLIAQEAWSKDFDDSLFTEWVDQNAVKEFGTWMLNNALATGAEYSAMTSKDIQLVATEKEDVYQENVEAWKDSHEFNAEVPALIAKFENILISLREKVYPEASRELAEKSDAYRRNQIRLSDYVEFLVKLADANQINYSRFDMISKMKSTFDLEDKIDYNAIENERLALVDQVKPKLVQEELSKLVTQSLYLRLGRVSAGEYYSYLESLAKQNDIDLATHKNLGPYIELSKLYDQINNNVLYGEIDQIENELKDKIFNNEDQKKLDKLFKDALILSKLTSLKMTRADLIYFDSNKKAIEASALIQGAKALAEKVAVPADLTGLDTMDDSIDSCIAFYDHARERDGIMTENSVNAMHKNNKNVIAFVTGGFHTDGIMQRLKDQEISYVVIAPRITKDDPDSQTRYEKSLNNKADTLYQETLQGTAETLQPQGVLASLDAAAIASIAQKLGAATDAAGQTAAKAAIEEALRAAGKTVESVEVTAGEVRVVETAGVAAVVSTFKKGPDGAPSFGEFTDSGAAVEDSAAVRAAVSAMPTVADATLNTAMKNITQAQIEAAIDNVIANNPGLITDKAAAVKAVMDKLAGATVNFRQLSEGEAVFSDANGRVAGAIYTIDAAGNVVVDAAYQYALQLTDAELASVMQHELLETAIRAVTGVDAITAHAAIRNTNADNAQSAWDQLMANKAVRAQHAASAALADQHSVNAPKSMDNAALEALVADLEARGLITADVAVDLNALIGLSNTGEVDINTAFAQVRANPAISDRVKNALTQYSEGFDGVVKGTERNLAMAAYLQAVSTRQTVANAQARLAAPEAQQDVFDNMVWDSSVFGATKDEARADKALTVEDHSYNAKALNAVIPAGKKIAVFARQGVEAFRAYLSAQGISAADIAAKWNIVEVNADELADGAKLVAKLATVTPAKDKFKIVVDHDAQIPGLAAAIGGTHWGQRGASRADMRYFEAPRGSDLVHLATGLADLLANPSYDGLLNYYTATLGYNEADARQVLAELGLSNGSVIPPTPPANRNVMDVFKNMKLQMAVERYA